MIPFSDIEERVKPRGGGGGGGGDKEGAFGVMRGKRKSLPADLISPPTIAVATTAGGSKRAKAAKCAPPPPPPRANGEVVIVVDDDEVDTDPPCVVCGEQDDESRDALLCDGCDRPFHLTCLTPPSLRQTSTTMPGNSVPVTGDDSL